MKFSITDSKYFLPTTVLVSKLFSRYSKKVFMNSVDKLEERTFRVQKRLVAKLHLEFRQKFYDFGHFYWCGSTDTKNN